jgi:hypothetical protein
MLAPVGSASSVLAATWLAATPPVFAVPAEPVIVARPLQRARPVLAPAVAWNAAEGILGAVRYAFGALDLYVCAERRQ